MLERVALVCAALMLGAIAACGSPPPPTSTTPPMQGSAAILPSPASAETVPKK